jgi:hypothetical protein
VADPRITATPLVITVSPETLARLDRLVAEMAALTTALAARQPIDPPDLVLTLPMDTAGLEEVATRATLDAKMFVPCRAEIYRRGDRAVYLCNRETGHPAAEMDAGHVAEVDGQVLACSTCTEFNRRTVDMVCQTCGTDYGHP